LYVSTVKSQVLHILRYGNHVQLVLLVGNFDCIPFETHLSTTNRITSYPLCNPTTKSILISFLMAYWIGSDCSHTGDNLIFMMLTCIKAATNLVTISFIPLQFIDWAQHLYMQ